MCLVEVQKGKNTVTVTYIIKNKLKKSPFVRYIKWNVFIFSVTYKRVQKGSDNS